LCLNLVDDTGEAHAATATLIAAATTTSGVVLSFNDGTGLKRDRDTYGRCSGVQRSLISLAVLLLQPNGMTPVDSSQINLMTLNTGG